MKYSQHSDGAIIYEKVHPHHFKADDRPGPKTLQPRITKPVDWPCKRMLTYGLGGNLYSVFEAGGNLREIQSDQIISVLTDDVVE